MIFTDNFTPEELAILSNVIAIELCKDRAANEISVISSFLSAVGDIMAIIAALFLAIFNPYIGARLWVHFSKFSIWFRSIF